MRKVQNIVKVVSNKRLSPVFYHLCLDAGKLSKSVRPGQFVNIKITDGLDPFFRRPFSVYRAQKHIEIFYEVIGKGTEILSAKKKGEALDILGPLGRGFDLPPQGTRQVVMIAGGVGVAPFMILSDALQKTGCEMILLYGARTKAHVFSMRAFKTNGCKVFVSTDDGSAGIKGNVTKLFSKIRKNPKTTFIYTCGPKPMMAAVSNFAQENQLSGQVAYEELMACGLGACLGCSVQTVHGYRTVCHDGPVFGLDEVIFS